MDLPQHLQTSRSIRQQNNIQLNIAIIGETGSGKSTFVNAFRGIYSKDKGATPTGCVETTMVVLSYPYPNYPNVTLWDLPGIGTTKFPADKDLKDVGFEKFDFFIIVSADRIRENDVKLAKEIQRMEKKLYFLCSKTDHNLCDEARSQRAFNAKRTLEQIRKNCIQVIIMSNPLDCKAVEKEVQEALLNNDQAQAVAKIQEYLDYQNNIQLNIAVTGETGSGKSTFVNAFRGIYNTDKGAAPTGCVETTMVVSSYPHPNYPNVTLWDLPGIGTTKFPADKYLKHVGFEKFDFFIIVSADRFRENDVKLAKEIQRMEKNFYFVRSKIDHNLCDEKRSQREFNAKRTLEQIRKNCIQGLQEEGFESPHVFLVSSFELHLYDFHLLEETLEKELPSHKRNVLLFAMPNVSLQIINKKKEAFQSQIKYLSTLSAAAAGVPLPGLSVAVDVSLLVTVVMKYVAGFGVDIPSLERLAVTTGVPFNDLKTVILSPLAAVQITRDLIEKVLLQCVSIAALMLAEEGSRFIPVLGIPAAMSLSFTATYRTLNYFLNTITKDAQRVFTKALGLNTSV